TNFDGVNEIYLLMKSLSVLPLTLGYVSLINHREGSPQGSWLGPPLFLTRQYISKAYKGLASRGRAKISQVLYLSKDGPVNVRQTKKGRNSPAS
ncbi:hypothetical protein J6590_021496, partial [Homalodisca vitripennis]